MTIQEINALAEELMRLRAQKNDITAVIDHRTSNFQESIRNETELLSNLSMSVMLKQSDLLAALKENQLNGWKTDKASISVKRTVSYSIEDLAKASKWLKRKKLYDTYAVTTFKPTIKEVFQNEEVPGVVENTKEFISILQRKDK